MDACSKLQLRLNLIILTCMLTAAAIEVHQFEVGTNASVTFHQRLNESSSAECEVFSLNEAQPFYKNHHIDESALQPNQRGRFNISTERRGENFTLTLHIYNIQKEDEGVYILSMKETIGEHSNTHISDAYIEVLLPLGKAECNVRDSLYTSHYYEVSCYATLGSDRTGFLLCYQIFEKAPTNGDVERSTDIIRASFWMLRDSSIYCCSFRSDEEISQDSCTDFVYQPAGMQHETTSVKPSETTARDQQSTIIKISTSSLQDGHTSRTDNEQSSVTPENQSYVLSTFYLVIACFVVNILTIVLLGSVLGLHLRQKKTENKKHQTLVHVPGNGGCVRCQDPLLTENTTENTTL